MPNGTIGDHPLTDSLHHGRHPFPPDIERLILAIAAITPEALHDTKMPEAEWFAWEKGERLDDARRILSAKLRQFQAEIGTSGYESPA
jgi:hypothetical protein